MKEQQRLQRKEEKRAKKHGLQTEAPCDLPPLSFPHVCRSHGALPRPASEELRKRAEKERLEQAYAQLTAMTPEKARPIPPLCLTCRCGLHTIPTPCCHRLRRCGSRTNCGGKCRLRSRAATRGQRSESSGV